jgi:hypothetical protein
MKICPLGTEVLHAKRRQNEANSCDQHHTEERAPVPIVGRIGAPI